jgi:hypothetical protein
MSNRLGPWARLISTSVNTQFNSCWRRRRMAMLMSARQTSTDIMIRTLLAICMAAILAFLTLAPRPVLGEQPRDVATMSAEQLAAAATNQLTSIKSLQCEYRYQFGDKPNAKTIMYARSGDKWHYTESETAPEVSEFTTECCDGQIAFSFCIRHRSGTSDNYWYDTVYLRDAHDPSRSVYPDQMLGASLSNVERSILDVLKAADVSKSLVDSPDGANQARLLVRDVPGLREGREKIKHDVSVTLDAKHDFLPAEIVVTQSEAHKTWPGWEQRWKILEYRRVRDEATHQERWFPVSAVLTQGDTGPAVKVTIDDVKINSDLQSVLFHPDLPAVVRIYDYTTDGRGGKFTAGRRFREIIKKKEE